ncbi:Heat stress transcription factor C-1 [Entamoeba marina]
MSNKHNTDVEISEEQVINDYLKQTRVNKVNNDKNNYLASVALFVSKLYNLVNAKESWDYIHWSEEFNKKAVMIPDLVEFSKKILPKYFKNSNICSFIRQLNVYGFRKLETQKGFCFKHEYFVAERPDLLLQINRKNQKKKKKQQKESMNSVLPQQLFFQITLLQRQNDTTQLQINTLKEILRQLNVRQDQLEYKMFTINQLFMPLIYENTSFYPESVISQTTSNTYAPLRQHQLDENNPYFDRMHNYSINELNQPLGIQQPHQTTASYQINYNCYYKPEDKGFIQWDQ